MATHTLDVVITAPTAINQTRSKSWLLRLAGVCIFLLVAACDPLKPQPPGWEIESGWYRYTIADRYGLKKDNNVNGIVDMPNSIEYVQGPLQVNFDFKAVADRYPSKWPLSEGEDPGMGNLQGPWRWTFTPIAIYHEVANLPLPPPSASGIVGRNESGLLTAFSDGPEIAVQLYEGRWRVELAHVDVADPYGEPIYWAYAELTLEDYLIIQLGDSFSSGQGAPEKYSDFGVWGDDGTVKDYPHNSRNYEPCISVNINPVDLDCVRRVAFGSMVNFEHEQAHRSSKTWGSVAAQAVEDYDSATSVTFLNLAASGALMKHLTEPYENPIPVLYEDLEVVNSMVPFADIFLTKPLPPQLEQMQELVGPRPIDALLISIGGNDAGFAPVIAAYLLNDTLFGIQEGPSSEDILPAIQDGDWHWFGSLKAWMLDLFGLVDFPDDILGTTGLLPAYQELNTILSNYGITDSSIVYIAEYPDPLVSDYRFTRDHWGAEVCSGDILTQVKHEDAFDYEITPEEQQEIRQELIIPLNNEIYKASFLNGWSLINSATAMYGRPICSGEGVRLMNRYKESIEHQGDESGMVHPNEAGYAAVAEELLRQFHLPNKFRNEADLDLPLDVNFTVEELTMGEFDLQEPGSIYTTLANDHRLFSYDLLGSPLEEPPKFPQWGTFGFPYPANRLYLSLLPSWCEEGQSLLIDMRQPIDHEFQNDENRWMVRYIGAVPEPTLQILRDENGGWEPVAMLNGYGSLLYNFSLEESREGRFRVMLSNDSVRHSPPEPFAKLRLRSSYNNEWGVVQLRTGCVPAHVPGIRPDDISPSLTLQPQTLP